MSTPPSTAVNRASKRPRARGRLCAISVLLYSLILAMAQVEGGPTTCPVDVAKVRLDSGLAVSCDTARTDFCDSCICDFAGRLSEAGCKAGRCPFASTTATRPSGSGSSAESPRSPSLFDL